MSSARPVVIYPPGDDGGRCVCIEGAVLGHAFCAKDVAAILQGAGLRSFSELGVAYSALIEWRGGGPDVWQH